MPRISGGIETVTRVAGLLRDKDKDLLAISGFGEEMFHKLCNWNIWLFDAVLQH